MGKTSTNGAKAATLFDLDGVLVDSESQYTICWDAINKVYPTGIADFARRIKGTTLTNILSTYFDPSVHEDIIRRLDEFERNMHYDIKPGVLPLLSRLRELKIPVAMVTSSNDEKMRRLWEHQAGLRQYFDHIVTADMMHRSKPDPEGYLIGAKLCGVSPTHCAVFEDSLQGVHAGHAAGAYVVGITGTVKTEALREYADTIVDTLENFDIDALLAILENRNISA